MAILKISELRRIIARQPLSSPVHLPLQGKGSEQKEGKNIKGVDQKRGLLLFQVISNSLLHKQLFHCV